MEAFFNLSLPKSWADLSDPQLLFFFRQLATDKPMTEIQTLCLCQWANILVRCRLYGNVYLVQHAKQQAVILLHQFVCAITALDFLKSFPPYPIRIRKIGKAAAIATDFQGIPFSTFISTDNYYQGFLHTHNTELLKDAATLLYPRIKRTHLTTKSTLEYFAIDIFPSRIKESLKVAGKLLSFTIHYGHLAKTFYVSYAKPYLTLLAMNELDFILRFLAMAEPKQALLCSFGLTKTFGCPEYIHLICVTKRKLDISRSTATCLGASTFYDDNTAYEYEVESAMLTLEQTDHLSILLLSKEISIISNSQSIPIIITDITSEISDADNATNALKFKYKYARHHIPKSLKYPQNIFDDPFHRTFD